jgi:hypothetical protein
LLDSSRINDEWHTACMSYRSNSFEEFTASGILLDLYDQASQHCHSNVRSDEKVRQPRPNLRFDQCIRSAVFWEMAA